MTGDEYKLDINEIIKMNFRLPTGSLLRATFSKQKKKSKMLLTNVQQVLLFVTKAMPPEL